MTPGPDVTSAPWTIGASTLGAPGDDLATVLRRLVDARVSAVELRVAAGEPVEIDASPARRAEVRAQVAEAGIAVLACASYVRVGANRPDVEVVDDLVGHLRLAADLGASFLRVFPGAPVRPGPPDRVPQTVEPRDVVDARIVTRLAAALDTARDVDVRLALETHDSHPRGQDLAPVLRSLDRRWPGHRIGAVWDVAHPFRTGETPERTWAELGAHLLDGSGFVQVKDIAATTDPTPVLIGHGAVPLATITAVLRHGGYRGPLSLEWERTWYPHVEPLTEALDSLDRWLHRQET